MILSLVLCRAHCPPHHNITSSRAATAAGAAGRGEAGGLDAGWGVWGTGGGLHRSVRGGAGGRLTRKVSLSCLKQPRSGVLPDSVVVGVIACKDEDYYQQIPSI